jgi:hypothetical protein
MWASKCDCIDLRLRSCLQTEIIRQTSERYQSLFYIDIMGKIIAIHPSIQS